MDILYNQLGADFYKQEPIIVLFHMLLRMFSAILIGGIIGLERKYKKKPAGMITSIFVCLGAAIVAITQELLVMRSIELVTAFPELQQVIKVDVGRMTAQVVSGIGFLGAGVIMYNKDKISGITTATILWVLASLGLLIGHGYLLMAFMVTILIIFTLTIIRKLEIQIFKRRKKSKNAYEHPEE